MRLLNLESEEGIVLSFVIAHLEVNVPKSKCSTRTGGRGRHQTPSEQILILNYRFLNFLNLSYPPPIFQYVIVVIKSNPNPNETVLYDHIFIANIPEQKVPITLLYNHDESLIKAAVRIGKIHKVRENKWTWLVRTLEIQVSWVMRQGLCRTSTGNKVWNPKCSKKFILSPGLPDSDANSPATSNATSDSASSAQQPQQPNSSDQDSAQTKPFTKASNGTTRQTMTRRPIQRFSSTSTRPFIQTRKSHALPQTHTTSQTHGLTNPNPLPAHKTA